MISSLRDICILAVEEYAMMARAEWVFIWPGMISICASSIDWTTSVTEAIEESTLPVLKLLHSFFCSISITFFCLISLNSPFHHTSSPHYSHCRPPNVDTTHRVSPLDDYPKC